MHVMHLRVVRMIVLGLSLLMCLYLDLVLFSLFNYRNHCRTNMPNDIIREGQRAGQANRGKCVVDLESLGKCTNARWLFYMDFHLSHILKKECGDPYRS